MSWKPAADDHDNREASAGVGNDVHLPPCNDNTYEDVITYYIAKQLFILLCVLL